MVVAFFRPITAGRQGRGGRLKGCVVRHSKTIVVGDVRGLAVFQIAIADAEEIRYLLLATSVRPEPSVLKPLLQAHARPQLRKAFPLRRPG